jgi:hypothetical protein
MQFLKVKKEINLIAIELRFTFERIAIIKIKCYELNFDFLNLVLEDESCLIATRNGCGALIEISINEPENWKYSLVRCQW